MKQGVFGFSVSISGNKFIVGSTSTTLAYVFEEKNGVWKEVQKLTASDGESGDDYATSVSISGDNIVIGGGGGLVLSPPWPRRPGSAYFYDSSILTNITEESIEKGVVVYPNPAEDIVTISLDELDESTKITIYNGLGVKAYDENLVTTKTNLDLSTYAKGVYILQVEQGDKVITKRFVKN